MTLKECVAAIENSVDCDVYNDEMILIVADDFSVVKKEINLHPIDKNAISIHDADKTVISFTCTQEGKYKHYKIFADE